MAPGQACRKAAVSPSSRGLSPASRNVTRRCHAAGCSWNGSWTGDLCSGCVVCMVSVRDVLSVQLDRSGRGVVRMVRRRSTVRFRKRAPGQRHDHDLSGIVRGTSQHQECLGIGASEFFPDPAAKWPELTDSPVTCRGGRSVWRQAGQSACAIAGPLCRPCGRRHGPSTRPKSHEGPYAIPGAGSYL
jgi:hypothetical protein